VPLVRRSAGEHSTRCEPGGMVQDERALKKYPTLCEFLGATVWPDGAGRETGSVSLFVEGGAWKAAVNDRDASMSAYVTKTTLEGILDAIEGGLLKDSLDWRSWKKGGVAKRK
jgi:hypothetical protein